jgi:acyl-CoA reductase-like NAD-dependent aldehyde dehydrogenase
MMRYRMGDPLDEATTLGPLADHRAPEQLQRQVDDALQRGARLVFDGPSLPNSGNFFAPTLIADAPQAALVMREESFGPLLPVAAVAGDDEALQRMNDSTLGLTASVWTRDADRAERLAGNIAAGTVYQNRADYLDPMLPWTGWGDSGIGSTLSRYGFHGLTRRKSLHLRL